jgi:hypothetical protein
MDGSYIMVSQCATKNAVCMQLQQLSLLRFGWGLRNVHACGVERRSSYDSAAETHQATL